MSKNKVVKNYLYDLSYQIILLIAPLITTPYVVRVLGATNLGIHGYVASISTYFVLFGTVGTSLYGRREIAFYQEDKFKRTKVFREILIIRLVLTTFAVLVYAAIFCLNNQYVIIYRIFLIDIIANAFDISWFFQGLQDFKKTVIRNAIVKLVGIVLIFIFIKDANQLPLYSIFYTVPVFLGHLTLWPYLKQYTIIEKIKLNVKSHIKPVFSLFIPQIAVEIYTVLDKTMIGVLHPDIAEVDYYTETQKVIKIALKLVTSIGVVMLPSMALDYVKGDEGKLLKSTQNAFRYMSCIGIPVMFGLIGISDGFVPWFYGEGFDPIKIILKMLAPIVVIIGYSTVIGSNYLLATKQQKIYTGSVIAGSCINFIGNIFLIPRMGAVGAAISSVCAELSVTIIQIFFTRKKIPILKFTLSNWKYYISSIIMLVAVVSIHIFLNDSILTTFIQIAVGTIIYAILLSVLKDEMFILGINTLKSKFYRKK